MKNNFYPIILTIIFSVLLLFMYYRVSNLEYKYETLKEADVRLKSNLPLTDTQTKERQFKEESYIRQQEGDTNLILIVFTIALGMTAFLTIAPASREFKTRTRIIEKKYANYSSNIEIKHNDFEFKLDYNQGNFYANLYNKNVDDKNVEMSLYYALCAFSDFTNCCLSISYKNDDVFKTDRVGYIKNGLKGLTKSKQYKIDSEFGGTVQSNISNIRKLEDVEIDILLSKLQASIGYEIRKPI